MKRKILAKKRKIKSFKRKSSSELLQAIKENKDNEQQSRNRKRIGIIRKKLKDLGHNYFKIELKEIRKNFYNIEKKSNLIQKELINILMN